MSNNLLPLLAQRVLNTPLAIHPGKAEVILAALGQRFGVEVINPGAYSDWDDDGVPASASRRDAWPGYDVVDGVAVVQIGGTLVSKLGCVGAYSGMTGYDGIRQAFCCALKDSAVRAIVLDIDSPGGETSGCFDLVDMIRRSRGSKPIWAILTESAYSAAYALASAADRIIIPRTGGAGSIGVVLVLTELSGLLKKEGITVNIIQFGAKKTDGNPFQALPASARQKLQKDIDKIGELFIDTVADNRRIAPKTVRDTEAATFMSDDALRLKLVDAVMAPDDAFASLQAHLARVSK